ncbi:MULTISPECIES: hypothetical protein [Alphaproteobacteria]|uniref:Uncharacterized protein n=2 Tax=Alphaproteobacteria TaxID=28211 RepID=A0A512HKQ1_9HYPH|nr:MULTISPECIES: hypothetical protein [Alphaproteobacteria]GEO86025.1 hypothetical protein RNA01_29570 [Ciceribacter naphthalenivorans]GLR22112.1 hypothetical protein GCM10007920_18990 [Ciceribacter naphthalenivorans]GLT04968.1 hypothetical protein GCM10007926_18990 [Sphingomonas psychrolutea]
MFTAAHDPFLFRLAVFVLAILAGWFLASRGTRDHRQPFVVVAGLLASAMSSGAILAVIGLPAGYGRNLSFLALMLASAGVVAGLLIAGRRVSAAAARDDR